MGPITHLGLTDLLRVCGSGYDFWNRWRRIGRIGVTDFGFGIWSFVDEVLLNVLVAQVLSDISPRPPATFSIQICPNPNS